MTEQQVTVFVNLCTSEEACAVARFLPFREVDTRMTKLWPAQWTDPEKEEKLDAARQICDLCDLLVLIGRGSSPPAWTSAEVAKVFSMIHRATATSTVVPKCEGLLLTLFSRGTPWTGSVLERAGQQVPPAFTLYKDLDAASIATFDKYLLLECVHWAQARGDPQLVRQLGFVDAQAKARSAVDKLCDWVALKLQKTYAERRPTQDVVDMMQCAMSDVRCMETVAKQVSSCAPAGGCPRRRRARVSACARAGGCPHNRRAGCVRASERLSRGAAVRGSRARSLNRSAKRQRLAGCSAGCASGSACAGCATAVCATSGCSARCSGGCSAGATAGCSAAGTSAGWPVSVPSRGNRAPRKYIHVHIAMFQMECLPEDHPRTLEEHAECPQET